MHFSCPLCLDSWKFVIEVHWTVRAPLVFVGYRACCLGGQVWGDFPGLCKFLHETTPLGSYGTTWDARRAYLSFSTFVGTGLSGLTFVWTVEAIGRRWSLVGLDLILHCWSAGTSCARVSGRGLLLRPLVRPTEPLQALRWTISILSSAACFFGLEFTDKLEFMDR